jgi:hypothetical protein
MYEVEQRYLGGVADPVEHGFPSEQAPNMHSVDATGQFAILPAFHTMSMAGAVEFGIRLYEGWGHPGSWTLGGYLSTAEHDVRESLVNRHAKPALARQLS